MLRFVSSVWSVDVEVCEVSTSPGMATFLARFVARSECKAVSGASSALSVSNCVVCL